LTVSAVESYGEESVTRCRRVGARATLSRCSAMVKRVSPVAAVKHVIRL
jgi:hypothetical protein